MGAGKETGRARLQVRADRRALRPPLASLWAAAPRDTILIELSTVGEATAPRAARAGTELRFRWLTDSPPNERGVGLVRYRLNYIRP